jgi:hypothetical protein
MKRLFLCALVLVTMFGSGCATRQAAPASSNAGDPNLAILDRLSFGQNIPGGGQVSEEDVQTFLAEVVTPRFPQGFAIIRGEGQWRDPSGVIGHEHGFRLEVNHPDAAAADKLVEEIAAEYKRRFKQLAVFRNRMHVAASLL